MAPISKFKNATKEDVGNSWHILYTAPSGKDSYVIELDIASKGNTGVQISVRVHDISSGDDVFIVKQAPVPLGSSLQVIDGQKLVLEVGDRLEVICDSTGEFVDAIASLIEDVNN